MRLREGRAVIVALVVGAGGAGLTFATAAAQSGPGETNPGVTPAMLNDLARAHGKAGEADPLMAWTADCLRAKGERAIYHADKGMMEYDGDLSLMGACFDELRAS